MSRLYHCARLVHADLSEYNLLISPCWQASHDHLGPTEKRTAEDELLQVVMIDFGQAVEVGHPSAETWLRRDLSTVRAFFVKQRIKALSDDDAIEFVTAPFERMDNAMDDDEDTEDKSTAIEDTADAAGDNAWRHAKHGWDDQKELDVLLKRLKGASLC